MFLNDSLSRRIRRKQIMAFIETDPVLIVLERHTYTSDAAGGLVKSTPVPLPPQVGKFVPRSAAYQLPIRLNEDGQSIQPTELLVMDHKADVKRNDIFQRGQSTWKIVYVHEPKAIKTVCEVVLNV